MRLPERLVGLALDLDGKPIGGELPPLQERGATEAWRRALGKGPYYVRFEERTREPDLDQVQRLARLGEVWLDCAIHDVEGALDILVAGAAKLVLWNPSDELLQAIDDSAVLGWDGDGDLAQVLAAADALQVPVLALAPLPPSDRPRRYQAPPRPWVGAFPLLYVGTPIEDPVSPESEADAKDDA